MLFDQLAADLTAAMKDKNQIRLAALRMLKSAIQNKAIEMRTEKLSDEDILGLIQKQIKQRKDAIELFKKGGRNDLIDKETAEIDILQQYLPKPLSPEELRSVIKNAIQAVEAKAASDIGKIMKEAMPKLKGKVDGKEVNKVALELLAEMFI